MRWAEMPSITRSAVEVFCGNAAIILVAALHHSREIGWQNPAIGIWLPHVVDVDLGVLTES